MALLSNGGIDAQIDRCGEFVIVHAAFKHLRGDPEQKCCSLP